MNRKIDVAQDLFFYAVIAFMVLAFTVSMWFLVPQIACLIGQISCYRLKWGSWW